MIVKWLIIIYNLQKTLLIHYQHINHFFSFNNTHSFNNRFILTDGEGHTSISYILIDLLNLD